jgi:hypothetical protein
MSDFYIKDLKKILKKEFKKLGKVVKVKQSSVEQDTKQNIDMLVYIKDVAEPIQVSCRVRGLNYFNDRFKDDFSIRIKMNGKFTELSKILEGKGQFILYGFVGNVNEDKDYLVRYYTIYDFDVFRTHVYDLIIAGRFEEKKNTDGVSSVAFFNSKNFPREIIFARNFQ